MVLDSGKLAALDRLLPKLKAEGHRVLIYCQMTRMIDIMEVRWAGLGCREGARSRGSPASDSARQTQDYMHYRGYTYLRLDGSSRISERRDMVQDFQNR